MNDIYDDDYYSRDFLKRCSDYGIFEPNTKQSEKHGNDTLTQQVLHRNQKIEKYRQKKELEDQTRQLKTVMDKENVDDETKREFYIKLLKMSIIEAQDELASIDQENQFINFQQSNRTDEEPEKCLPSRARPLKPIIITRDLAQKAIYGLGYPSLPTMTVAEFYDQRVREGIFPDPTKASGSSNSLPNRFLQEQSSNSEPPEDIEREEKLEQDDEYEVARLRARDEYKDNHRRGEGNRYNRS